MSCPQDGMQESALAALLKLGLSPEELAALACQGFVAREQRSPGPPLHKLRFRLDGRQRVKSLGRDALLAARIQTALDGLQRGRRLQLVQRQLRRQAARALRSCKPQLAPALIAAGLKFHGWAIRKPRCPAE